MWLVVHFLNEDSIETIPHTWFQKQHFTCAWPLAKNSAKKRIEKRTMPNKLEFEWLTARTLGKSYGKSSYLCFIVLF